jgi:alginate O-acetyltransferase complex protein AlgI
VAIRHADPNHDFGYLLDRGCYAMIFNSLSFALFFVITCAIFYAPLSWANRKAFLTLASYAFYAGWYPSLIVLLWASTVFDWFVTRRMLAASSTAHRRLLLVGSVILNIGFLAYFKYGAFLAENVNLLFDETGFALPIPDTLLPVGISFYTFMSLSYVIDTYRGVAKPAGSFLDFALFLTFFPHLVAGPIVRSADFLPQCTRPKRFSSERFAWGLVLLVIGLFEKTVIADALLAPVSDRVFAVGAAPTTLEAWLGTFAFSGQILCDFTGYSTCAIGAAACLGFRLPENFRAPYAARGFSDFWRRWHMSLSQWLRDYLYVSLGGNRRGELRTYINLSLTMLLGGLWHGASWTFVVWGALHGLYLILERLARGRTGLFALLIASVPVTYLLVSIAWVFFRAPEVGVALDLITTMSGVRQGSGIGLGVVDIGTVVLVTAAIFAVQRYFRERTLQDAFSSIRPGIVATVLALMIVAIVTLSGDDRAFIYFQF